ncbi:MAG: DUF4390 domain-containing protein [Aquincola sp.]|nr:DUF4390 domain-containing protein [Aquincola sp.]MDH4287102.1 DUF4390 domain-containing protein [Aquincola sp.]MDH5328722.1 DUF4390 domain-containing protein [Aquincola sp.]
MPPVTAARQTNRPRSSGGWRRLALAAVLVLLAPHAPPAQAQGVEVLDLSATRDTEMVTLDYQLRLTLPRAVQEAALRGVPIYFRAIATLWKPRWYWRDERVARVRREWRLAYQPLTSTWRVSQGGLGQSHATLAEAVATMANISGWHIADAAQVEEDSRHYVEFNWELDTSQLPRPLQIGLTGVGGSDWALGVERTVRLADAAPEGK